MLSASNTHIASYGAFSSIFCCKNQSNAAPLVLFDSSYLSNTIASRFLATLAVLSVQLSAITYMSYNSLL